MPEVTVIIPNYNHARYLTQRIDSVLTQTYQQFEVIILDDCSSDNSREIIESYRRHPLVKQIIYNDTNSGNTFKQWQKGIGLAAGEYLWIAESDDWASPDFLELLMQKIMYSSNVGICFAGSNWVDDGGNVGKDLSIYNHDFTRAGVEEIKKYLVKYNTIQNASAAVLKKDLAEKYIKNALQYRSCGDWCLYIDMLQESNLVYIDKKLNNFRWYHNNISNAAFKKGLWISESLKIIAFSRVYKIKFSRNELIDILKYWYIKPNQFSFLKRLRMKLMTLCYFLVFTAKVTFYHLIPGK